VHLINIEAATVFQALAEPTRIRIIRLLATTKDETCLCELVDSLLEPEYKLSRHLKILRQSGLLKTQKDGRWIYHRLVNGHRHLTHIYAVMKALPDTDGIFAADHVRFQQRMRLREAGRCRVGIRRSEFAVGGRR
jgi:ArsR family transcriptional regulator